MTEREKFERWARTHNYKVDWSADHYKYSLTQQAWDSWQLRQPEIDALNAENERLRKLYDDAMCDCPSHSLPECKTCGKVIDAAMSALPDTKGE